MLQLHIGAPCCNALYAGAMDKNIEKFAAAPFIKEIGRGVKGARSMSREDARALYAAMLEGLYQ